MLIWFFMKVALEKPRPTKAKKTFKGITRDEISDRLVNLDLAHTSALRDLEMDISGEKGCLSSMVLKNARAALGK